jgi:hypothetical protein
VYDLVMSANSTWNEAAQQVTSCELLRRKVHIAAINHTIDTQYVIVGVVAAAAILAVMMLLTYQIRAHQEQAKRFLKSFIKNEGVLALKLIFEAWVRTPLGRGSDRPVYVPYAIRATAASSSHDRMDCLQDIGGDGADRSSLCSRSIGIVCSPVFFAVFGYVNLYRIGYLDLFIAQSVFIVPAVLTSVLSIGLKARLMVRGVQNRQAALERAAIARSRQAMMRPALRMLAQRLVLQHDEHAHEELQSANARHRYEGYCHIVGIATEAWPPNMLCVPNFHRLAAPPDMCFLPQDAPFAVANTLVLLRVVQAPASLLNGLCANPHDSATVTVLLLALLTSIASLTYKVMKVLKFPEVWREHQRLLREKVELAERACRLHREAPEAALAAESEGSSDSDSENDPLQGGR